MNVRTCCKNITNKENETFECGSNTINIIKYGLHDLTIMYNKIYVCIYF